MAERAGLLNRYTDLNLYRGFESLPLRETEGELIKKSPFVIRSGRSVARLSRLVWDQEVASSNLAAPTNTTKPLQFAGAFLMRAIEALFI